MQKEASGSPCRKLDKDHYIDIRTGEVLEYQHIDNRSECKESIRVTLARIRNIINANILEPKNCRWLTFTYADNMTDTKVLYLDFEKFWKRFLYWCKKLGYSKPEYIVVIEPQGRGAWHIHAFFIWEELAPFIPNDIVASLWGHGFTTTKAVSDVDNVGAYFSAYLGDMPVDDIQEFSKSEKEKVLSSGEVVEKSSTDEQGNIKQKKFVKGGRLYLYPSGLKIIRTSRGIRQPEIEYLPYSEAKEKVSAATETFSCAYEVVGDSGQVLNAISKYYYNSKR